MMQCSQRCHELPGGGIGQHTVWTEGMCLAADSVDSVTSLRSDSDSLSHSKTVPVLYFCAVIKAMNLILLLNFFVLPVKRKKFHENRKCLHFHSRNVLYVEISNK